MTPHALAGIIHGNKQMTTTTATRPLNLKRLFEGHPIPSSQTLRDLAAIFTKMADSREAQIDVRQMDGQFSVYCDGSALNNPGPGGWAFLIRSPRGQLVTRAGGIKHTTNNIAELTAATNAINALAADAEGVVRTDSMYVFKGLNEWRWKWENREWITSQGKPVANMLQWKALFLAFDTHPGVKLEWVRGHNGDEDNETVDRLARAEAEKVQHHTATMQGCA